MRAVALLVVVPALAVVAVGGTAAHPVTAPPEGVALDTAYVERLRAVATQVRVAARGVDSLPSRTKDNVPTLLAGGKRLAAATAAARDMLRVYRGATSRYGTAEEWRLVNEILTKLVKARVTFEQRARVTLDRPTAKNRSTARRLWDAAVRDVARRQAVAWTKDEGLADILTAGSLSDLDQRLAGALAERLRRGGERAIADALGVQIALDVPLKQQLRRQAEQLASGWLAQAVFHVGPQSFVAQLAGRMLVRWVGERLRTAFRHTGDAVRRAGQTMAQFAEWRNEMRLAPPTWPLRRARALAATVDRELGRTGFLEYDLQRAGKTDVLAQLRSDLSLTRYALVRNFRPRFLLDSPMAKADMNALVGRVKQILAEVEEINRRLKQPPPEEKTNAECIGARGLTGTWTRSGGGIFKITQAGTSVKWTGQSAPEPFPDGTYFFFQEFKGQIVDRCYVHGTWRDIPEKSLMKNSGELALKVLSPKLIQSVPRYKQWVTKPEGTLTLTRP